MFLVHLFRYEHVNDCNEFTNKALNINEQIDSIVRAALTN